MDAELLLLLLMMLFVSGTTKFCMRTRCNECEAVYGECRRCSHSSNEAATDCDSCEDGCRWCRSEYGCNSCYIGHEDFRVSVLQLLRCRMCSLHCLDCNFFNSTEVFCTTCMPQHYGIRCEHDCTEHCVDGQCTHNGCTKGCKTGFYADSHGVCRMCKVTCESCEGSGSCSACKPGFFGDMCEHSCKEHCMYGLCWNNRCWYGCSLGFYEHGYGECKMCPSFCASCFNHRNCTACKPGYYGKMCTQSCQEHCVDELCTQSGCTRGCKDGFYTVAGNTSSACLQCPQHCETCASETQCTACAPGFYGIMCDQRCDRCVDEECDTGGCTKGCKNEFYKDNNGTCQTCPLSCTSCRDIKHCSTCQPGYYGNKCEHSCREHCIDEQCTDAGCTSGCNSGYFKQDDGSCQMCRRSCTTCSNFERCTECKRGYYGSTCERVCYKCLEQNCTQGGRCVKGCNNGFYKNSRGLCQRCLHACATCSTFQQCASCKNGYYGPRCEHKCNLCVEGECTQEGCTKGCVLGYFKDPDASICNKCPNSCVNCTKYEQCSTCRPGHHGITCEHNCNTCVDNECTQGGCVKGCKSRFYLGAGNVCHDCQSHCIDGECSQGRCTKGCRDGFYRNSANICRRCLSSCVRCSNDASCDTCAVGKYGPTCLWECIDTCSNGTCHISSGTCSMTCAPGQFIDQTRQCSPCSSPCKSCINTSTTCTQCHAGHYLTKNTCNPCQVGCKDCKDIPNNCTECMDGYYLSGQACIECPTTCITCISNRTCSQCTKAKSSVAQKCYKCPRGCKKCTNLDRCDACTSGDLAASKKKTSGITCIVEKGHDQMEYNDSGISDAVGHSTLVWIVASLGVVILIITSVSIFSCAKLRKARSLQQTDRRRAGISVKLDVLARTDAVDGTVYDEILEHNLQKNLIKSDSQYLSPIPTPAIRSGVRKNQTSFPNLTQISSQSQYLTPIYPSKNRQTQRSVPDLAFTTWGNEYITPVHQYTVQEKRNNTPKAVSTTREKECRALVYQSTIPVNWESALNIPSVSMQNAYVSPSYQSTNRENRKSAPDVVSAPSGNEYITPMYQSTMQENQKSAPDVVSTSEKNAYITPVYHTVTGKHRKIAPFRKVPSDMTQVCRQVTRENRIEALDVASTSGNSQYLTPVYPPVKNVPHVTLGVQESHDQAPNVEHTNVRNQVANAEHPMEKIRKNTIKEIHEQVPDVENTMREKEVVDVENSMEQNREHSITGTRDQVANTDLTTERNIESVITDNPDQAPNVEPTMKETDDQVPNVGPAMKETDDHVPNVEPTFNETDDQAPNVEPTTKETDDQVPNVNPTMKETDDHVPTVEPTIKETDDQVPNVEPTMETYDQVPNSELTVKETQNQVPNEPTVTETHD